MYVSWNPAHWALQCTAGMSHEITISSLRKSRRILREQKRRSERRNQGAAGEEADDDGVDVE